MCPRSGYRSGGTCECALVPVFVPGEHLNVPSFRFSFRGNICQNHPFGNHPFRFLRNDLRKTQNGAYSVRDSETTIKKIKFAFLKWEALGQGGKSSRNAVFLGKRHDNKFLKVQI